MTVIKVAALCVLAAVMPISWATPAYGVDEAMHTEAGAEAHDSSGHDGSSSGKINPLKLDKDLAVWTFVVFVILLIVLRKFAWGPISAGLDKREQNIADHIAAAAQNHEEAKALLVQYDERLAKAAGEVREIIEEARRDAERTQKEILAKAADDALALQDRARREIETATAAALQELSQRSASLAVELAGKIVQAQLSRDDHARLIDDAVSQFTQPSTY